MLGMGGGYRPRGEHHHMCHGKGRATLGPSRGPPIRTRLGFEEAVGRLGSVKQLGEDQLGQENSFTIFLFNVSLQVWPEMSTIFSGQGEIRLKVEQGMKNGDRKWDVCCVRGTSRASSLLSVFSGL